MPGNQFSDLTVGNDLGSNAAEITPSATVFDGPIRVVCYDGTTIQVVTLGGQTVNIPIVAGLMLPVLVKRVVSSDATKIVGYW